MTFEEYKKLNDKNSSDEKVRNLRHEITKYFFDLYSNLEGRLAKSNQFSMKECQYLFL